MPCWAINPSKPTQLLFLTHTLTVSLSSLVRWAPSLFQWQNQNLGIIWNLLVSVSWLNPSLSTQPLKSHSHLLFSILSCYIIFPKKQKKFTFQTSLAQDSFQDHAPNHVFVILFSSSLRDPWYYRSFRKKKIKGPSTLARPYSSLPFLLLTHWWPGGIVFFGDHQPNSVTHPCVESCCFPLLSVNPSLHPGKFWMNWGFLPSLNSFIFLSAGSPSAVSVLCYHTYSHSVTSHDTASSPSQPLRVILITLTS